MSVFHEGDNSLDWRLLRESSVPVYTDQDLLTKHLDELAQSGYASVEFGCAEISGAELTVQLAAALGRPITGRGNYLAVLDDILYDPGRLSANIPTPGGLVYVLRDFDTFTVASERDSSAILEVLARHSRIALMIGLRWITVVHASDPDFVFQPLQHAVLLNADERDARANSRVDWSAIFGDLSEGFES